MKAVLLIVMFPTMTFGQLICNRYQPVADRCDLSLSPSAQAKCLLRPVKKFGNLGEPLGELPTPLAQLVGQTISGTITVDQLKQFLMIKGIDESEVGGSLSIGLSAPNYFVLHDTSDFLGEASGFPANINEGSWTPNRLSNRVSHQVAHVYINRLGESATAINFESASPPKGTKFGVCNPNQRPQFLHIENIQPRIRDRSVRFSNDANAPTPGFTDAQLDRLALIYVVASVRSGKWLIPAYHSPLDLGFPDRHDDPQNFDLLKWSRKLSELIEEIRAVE